MNPKLIANTYDDAAARRILVVDKDEGVRDLIKFQLQPEGFDVDWCKSSDELFNVNISDYKLLIVDLGNEEDAGMEVIEQVKQVTSQEGAHTAVIACSRRMTPNTIITALNSGADDYLLKPFSPREFMARVHAVLRRC